MFILIVTVGITCISQDEKARPEELRDNKRRSGFYVIYIDLKLDLLNFLSKFADVLRNIWNAVVNLPKPIRRVCYVQFFAFMGWFPFLFYA